MIRTGILLGGCFVATAVIEASFLSALPFPVSQLPLVFLVGVLLLHAHLSSGIIWMLLLISFVASGILPGSFLSSLVASVFGMILVRYFFSRRSVYGLLGLGTSMLAVFFLIRFLQDLSASISLFLFCTICLFLLHSIWQTSRSFFRSFLLFRGV